MEKSRSKLAMAILTGIAGVFFIAAGLYIMSLLNKGDKIVYLSPSTQYENIYADGVTTEGGNMQIIADLVAEKLGDEYTVLRNDPEGDVKKSVELSNASDAVIHVALHSNATGDEALKVRGCEVYVRPHSVLSSTLAECIYEQVSEITPTEDRGVRVSRTLYEVQNRECPTVLVELDFHDDPAGAAFLLEKQDALAEAVAEGIRDYYKAMPKPLTILKAWLGR